MDYFPFSFRFIVCFSFSTAKFSSISVSVSFVCISSPNKSAMISPLFSISDFCVNLSGLADSSPMVRDSSRSLAKASIMAMVVYVALSPFSIVASM